MPPSISTRREGLLRTLRYFLEDTSKDSLRQLRIPLDTARGAVDGDGKRIILYRPPSGKTYTLESLKETTFSHLSRADPDAHYITLTPLGIDSSNAQEIAYWRNLALLATATALAIEHEADRGNRTP